MNERFIGITGGREQLSTPALLLDLDAFERNVAASAGFLIRSPTAGGFPPGSITAAVMGSCNFHWLRAQSQATLGVTR